MYEHELTQSNICKIRKLSRQPEKWTENIVRKKYTRNQQNGDSAYDELK